MENKNERLKKKKKEQFLYTNCNSQSARFI